MDQPPAIVIDGDTFRLGSERIRISNIDAPEMPGGAKCDAEANLALLAKDRLSGLLKPGDSLSITRQGVDRYGRTLALVAVNGGDVGLAMIEARLAIKWDRRRHDWCGPISP